MAGIERGIGSFLTGLSSGMKMRQGIDDRDWQSKARSRQQAEWSQADEDRAANKAWIDKAHAQQEKQWAESGEDRATRLANERANAGWLANERARQQSQWGREDALRQAQNDAFDAGSDERERAIGKSIFPAPTSGPTQDGAPLPDGFRVGSKFYDTKDQAREAAEKAAGSVFEHINGAHVDKVVKAALDAGDRQLAEAYPKWLQDQRVQAGIRHFSDAVGKWSVGDVDGAIDDFNSAFNARGYFDNGFSAKATNIKRDDGGKPVSADVVFTNDQTGAKRVQPGVGMDDLFHQAVNMLAPDQVIKFGLEKIKAEQEAAAADAKDRRALALDVAKKRAEMTLKREDEAASGVNPYAPSGGKMTEGQSRAAAYGDRMAQAENVLRETEAVNSGVAGGAGGLINNAVPDAVGNVIAGKDRQRANQAQRDFVNAILRRESGAAIAQSEFDNARQQYFPQPGDTAEAIAQKRQNRATAIRGLFREAGPSYTPPEGWRDPSANGGAQPVPATPKAASGPDRPEIASAADAGARIARARAAIAAGANPAVVAERLRGMGIDPGSLRQ